MVGIVCYSPVAPCALAEGLDGLLPPLMNEF